MNKSEITIQESTNDSNLNRYKHLFDHMNNGCSIWKRHEKDFIVTDYNQFGLQMDKLEFEAVIGSKLSNFQPKPTNIHDTFDHVLSTGQPAFIPKTEYEISGEPVFRSNYIFKTDEDEVVCLFQDLTAQTEFEQKLNTLKNKAEASEERLLLASNSAKLGIWDWNIITGDILWDERMFSLYGIQSTTNIASFDMWSGGLHPDDKQPAIDAVQDALDGKKDFDTNFRVVHSNGEIVHVKANASVLRNDKGEPIRMIGINRDITEFKKSEKELKDAKTQAERNAQELEEAQKVASLGSWFLDLETNEVIWTEELYKMYGFDPTVPPPPYTEHMKLFTPESWNKLSEELGKTRETGVPYELELEMVREGKANGWMWVRGEAVLDEASNIVGLRGVAQDVSKRKNLELELVKSKDKAEESDQLKSAFLANMSHEIRTPLNAILGFSNLLKDKDFSDDEREEFLHHIEMGGKRLLHIITDIMDISKFDANQLSLRYEVCSLNQIVNGLLAQFVMHPLNENCSIKAVKHFADERSNILSDETRLTQILSNLLENALKFTPKDGTIEFGYRLVGQNIEFYVKDNGIGISKEDQKTVFDRFKQANNDFTKSGAGTGLGLSIVQSLVKLFNGEVWVKSELGAGSTFFVSIPYLSSHYVAEQLTSSEDRLIENHDITILIAEDEETNFLYLNTLLKDRYHVIHAKNGEEALNTVFETGAIDLILMDLKMPVMNGYEATQKIRNINQDVPIVALTAYAMASDREKALKNGFNDFLTKPVSRAQLTEVINKFISARQS